MSPLAAVSHFPLPPPFDILRDVRAAWGGLPLDPAWGRSTMKTKQLIELLKRFDPEATVRLCVSLPNRVLETHERLWVGDYGGGPLINASSDFRGFQVYVGCGLEQFVTQVPEHEYDPFQERRSGPAGPELDLGDYEDEETARRVRDFYLFHRSPGARLSDPDFDYENWIPPRTRSGKYNEQIAKILEEKLLEE